MSSELNGTEVNKLLERMEKKNHKTAKLNFG